MRGVMELGWNPDRDWYVWIALATWEGRRTGRPRWERCCAPEAP